MVRRRRTFREFTRPGTFNLKIIGRDYYREVVSLPSFTIAIEVEIYRNEQKEGKKKKKIYGN